MRGVPYALQLDEPSTGGGTPTRLWRSSHEAVEDPVGYCGRRKGPCGASILFDRTR